MRLEKFQIAKSRLWTVCFGIYEKGKAIIVCIDRVHP
jgi:hypothetical protein